MTYTCDVTFGEDGIPGTIVVRIKVTRRAPHGKLVPVAHPIATFAS